MNVLINKFFTKPRPVALAFAAVIAGGLAGAPIVGSAQQAVAVVVNGQPMSFDQPPIIQAGRVFVPLRSIFQQLGASVVYANGQINATGRGRTVALTIGSTQGTVDGQAVTLDVAPFVVGSRTLVPLRFVAQSLGANVNWNDSTGTVTINSNANGNVYNNSNPNRGNRVAENNVITQAPPPLPEYEQPYAPQPNYIWTPGYWAWGSPGYYWVPGTWVQAPQTGLYWTPGYWSANNSGAGFAWNAGYWAPQVGFYGGVNYGFGYFGNGYQGGRWGSNGFAYNTAYSNVNRTIITNTYINRTVINTTVINRVSYNGGNGGVHLTPTAQQLTVAKAHHVTATPEQLKHEQAAAQDRQLYDSVNHGKPALPAVAKPLTTPPAARPAPTERPVPQQRATPQPRATVKPLDRPTVKPEDRPTVKPEPRATMKPLERPTVKPEAMPTARPEPRATVRPEPRATVRPEPRATVRPEPRATVRPEPVRTPVPKPAATERPVEKPTAKPQARPDESAPGSRPTPKATEPPPA
jgi:hypothetical protein